MPVRILHKLNTWWLAYEYKHTTLAVLAILLFVLLANSAALVALFGFLGNLGYMSGFIAGVFSVSFFTAVPALVLLIELAQTLNPFLLALAVGLGSVFGDWIILKFYEEKIFTELKPLLKKARLHRLQVILRRRSTSWILLLIGTFIISSPLPDEVGLMLLGISHFKQWAILIICFMLNFIGALLVIFTAEALL